MTSYAALVRAVNVSGTGKLPNADLKAMGEACGFTSVRTYINSGNLLFVSELDEPAVRERICSRIDGFFGRQVPVHVRSAGEMAAVAAANPFNDDLPSRVMAYFVDGKPSHALIEEARDINGERLAPGPRVVFVSYGSGIRTSRLKIPTIRKGTARNMNSVARMAELLAAMS